MEGQRGWTVGKKETDEGPSIVRIKDIETEFPFSDFPERLNVIWDFQEPTPASTPSADESSVLEAFENGICERIESSGEAVLCIVFTEPGYREFVFQARTTDSFLSALNDLPQKDGPYPIEIHHETDADFGLYQSYARSLLGR